jgi:hypothetical protein
MEFEQDSSDFIETELFNKKTKSYQNFISSEYNYLEYLRNKKIPQFQEETKNYVYDKEHPYYKYMFGENINININIDSDTGEAHYEELSESNKSQKITELFRKLSLICHPDKCQDEWGKNMFIFIKKAYDENKIDILEKIMFYFEENKTLDGYQNNSEVTNENKIITKEEQINIWKSEAWYNWYYVKNSIIKMVLVSENTLIMRNIKRKQKLEEENLKLREENAKMQEMLKTLQKYLN